MYPSKGPETQHKPHQTMTNNYMACTNICYKQGSNPRPPTSIKLISSHFLFLLQNMKTHINESEIYSHFWIIQTVNK